MKSSRGQEIEGSIDSGLLGGDAGRGYFHSESYLYQRGAPTPGKAFTFRADPAHASLLHDMGADLVSPNNHAYDYGVSFPDGYGDTPQSIRMPRRAAGIWRRRCGPVYYIAGDLKIAFLSATQIERWTTLTKGATETSGVFRWDVDMLLQSVSKQKQTAILWLSTFTGMKAPPSWTGRKRNRRHGLRLPGQI